MPTWRTWLVIGVPLPIVKRRCAVLRLAPPRPPPLR
jgi:hypothetical protein